MMVFCWLVTIAGAVAGGVALVVTFITSTGAPQQAAGAAIAVACSVIPYCFTRAVEKINRS
jgi:hypothetical protein